MMQRATSGATTAAGAASGGSGMALLPHLRVPSSTSVAVANSPTTAAAATRRLMRPRVLVFALMFLTLVATGLSYTLLIGGFGNEGGWVPSVPYTPPASGGYGWKRIPTEPKPPVTVTTGQPSTTIRTTLGVDTMSVYAQCHNTIQGRKLVTDDSGAICARQNVLRNGCCRSTQVIDRMSCGMCRTDVKCCRSYEYCVSCCLSKLPETDRASDSVATASPRVSFHSFDKCLHLCRTSSRSIKHGNVYRTPVLRHCYTDGDHSLPIKFEDSATTLVAKQGVSCSRTCAAYRGPTSSGLEEEADTPSVILPPPAAPPLYICHEAFLPLINNCETMLKHFQCEKDACQQNAGNDQPALIVNDVLPADLLTQPHTNRSHLPRGQCLLNGDEKLFDCEGHHESTQRLCVCIEADRVE